LFEKSLESKKSFECDFGKNEFSASYFVNFKKTVWKLGVIENIFWKYSECKFYYILCPIFFGKIKLKRPFDAYDVIAAWYDIKNNKDKIWYQRW
jgi:hypothetical protein